MNPQSKLSLTIIAVATNDAHRGFVALAESNRTPWPVHAWGVGANWAAMSRHTRWRWRMDQYVAACADAETEWVLIMDAYDTLFHPNAEARITTLLRELEADGTDVLIGSETWCGSNCRPLQSFPRPSHLYPNGGCILGRTKSVAAMYAWILAQWPAETDDQIGVSRWLDAAADRARTKLDVDARLVRNVVGWNDNFNVQLKHTTQAAVLHFPGYIPSNGWSRVYNACTAAWAATDLVPRFHWIPLQLAAYARNSEHAILFKFLIQIAAFWLVSAVLTRGRLGLKSLGGLGTVIALVVRIYLTFT